MKKILLIGEIAAIILVFAGFALGLVGSVMLALDNAMFDYYNHTSRQLAGWLLCFLPAVFGLLGMTAYVFRRKIRILKLVGSMVLFIAAIVPYFYMAINGAQIFVILGTLMIFVAALGSLAISYFGE